MESRKAKIFDMCNLQGFGLEIGGGPSPLLPKSEGYNVETLDHLSRDELNEKYKNRVTGAIQDIDYVWQGGSYTEAVGKSNCYDFIVASHVIEHSVCIISFLNDCINLLKPNGILSLVIPDKRFTFDRFRPLSGVSGAIDCLHSDKQRHSIGAYADWVLNLPLLENRSTPLAFNPHDAKKYIEDYSNADSAEYVDFHHWVFTKHSFELLVNDLIALGFLHNMRIAKSYNTEGVEFYVSIQKCMANQNLFYKEQRAVLLEEIKKELMQEEAFVDEGILAQISKHSSEFIYVYGTGNTGRHTALILEKHGISFHGFIVSDGMDKPDFFLDKPVYFLSQVECACGSVAIVLGMIASSSRQVAPLLSGKGARNVYKIF